MTKTRSPTRLTGITALIANGKWAVRSSDLRDIVSGFNAYLQGHASESTIREAFESRERRAETLQETQAQAPGVAIIALHGTIFPRGSMMTYLCGAVDPHSFADQVRAAANDASVASIVLDIDSGGGAVSGIDVAAQAVQEAVTKKKVTAVANTMACSAALWIGVQATEFVVTPAGEVGSIGVIGTHTDESAALENEGLKVTYVRSTERKALGQAAEAMEGAALEQWQSEVSRIHELFTQAVAEGRGVSLATARGWANAEVWFGQEAVDIGLADRVGTLDQVLQEHLAAATTPPAPTLRTGNKSAEDPQENPVLITVKDRTGKTHTIDSAAPDPQGAAQSVLAALEEGAYSAGIQTQRELVAAALGVEVKDLTAETMTNLRSQAADGASYRATLETQIEALAVSVYGADNTGSLDRMKRLASKASVEDLRGMVEDLQVQKSARFPGGRLSADAIDVPDAPPEGAPARTPDPVLFD